MAAAASIQSAMSFGVVQLSTRWLIVAALGSTPRARSLIAGGWPLHRDRDRFRNTDIGIIHARLDRPDLDYVGGRDDDRVVALTIAVVAVTTRSIFLKALL
jgi:hypothetical protein